MCAWFRGSQLSLKRRQLLGIEHYHHGTSRRLRKIYVASTSSFANVTNFPGFLRSKKGASQEAEKYFRKAIKIGENLSSPDKTVFVALMSGLADLLVEQVRASFPNVCAHENVHKAQGMASPLFDFGHDHTMTRHSLVFRPRSHVFQGRGRRSRVALHPGYGHLRGRLRT